jgi:hypothetical protein
MDVSEYTSAGIRRVYDYLCTYVTLHGVTYRTEFFILVSAELVQILYCNFFSEASSSFVCLICLNFRDMQTNVSCLFF